MKTSTPVVAALLLLAAGPATGDEKPNDRNPWNGFGIGSWAVRTESVTRDGKTESRREKRTRVAAKDPDTIELRGLREGKTPDVFDGGESTSWHIRGYDPALDPKVTSPTTTKQELVIQGKKYPCDVRTFDLSQAETKVTLAYWHCKDLSVPYREVPGPPRTMAVRPDVVRLDVDYRSKSLTFKMSTRVVSLADERKVGDKKVVCVREEGEFEMTEGGEKGKGKVTTYLSDAVPGREVETVAEGEIGGVKFRKAQRVDAFEVSNGK
jgi:hypothetical protein